MPRVQLLKNVGVVLLLATLAARVAAAQSTRLPGDANCDQHVDVADIRAVVAEIFTPRTACAGTDANGDGRVTVADVTRVELALPIPTPAATPTWTATPTITATATISPTPTIS